MNSHETVIVTGAGGFVGKHLIKVLIGNGYSVVAVVRDKSEFNKTCTFDNQGKLRTVEADLTDIGTLRRIDEMVNDQCYLIHLGAYFLKKPSSVENFSAERSISVNISGTYNLLRILFNKLSGVCIASTIDVYGSSRTLLINEESKLSPETFYSASKLAMESYATIELEGKIPLSILRLSHIYGPSDPHPKVMHTFINNIHSGKSPVIYGDGSDLRDFIHVEEVVDVILKMLNLKKEGLFVVATGTSYSVKEIAEIIIEQSGKDLAPIYRARRDARKDYVFDISKLKRELNFSPKISLLRGIKDLIPSNTP